jgi:hypothetical protein
LLFRAQLAVERIAEEIRCHGRGDVGGRRVVGQQVVADERRVHAGDFAGIDDVFAGADREVTTP